MATCKDCGVHLTAENTYGGKATWKCKRGLFAALFGR